jgi:hypothetical protein
MLHRNIKTFLQLKHARVAILRQQFLKEFEMMKKDLAKDETDNDLLNNLGTSFNWINAAHFLNNWLKRCMMITLLKHIRYEAKLP